MSSPDPPEGSALGRYGKALPTVRFSNQENAAGSNVDSMNSHNAPSILRNANSQGSSPHDQRAPFYKRLFNRRSNDYHDEGAGVPTPRRGGAPGEYRRRGSFNQTGNASDDDGHHYPRWFSWCSYISCLCRPNRKTVEWMSHYQASRFWQFSLVFFTMLLLFGSQLQELWVPKEGDFYFDILFTIALGVFVIDMLIRCYVEPNYFGFNLRKPTDASAAWGSCRLGSFMFWCDMISTATLLYDISFINRPLFDEETIEIELDPWGMPVSSCELNVGNWITLLKSLIRRHTA